jgi:hypothetical protein
MTSRATLAWPGIASAMLTIALALFLFGWTGRDAGPPPADTRTPRAASPELVAPIALPPPPKLAPKALVQSAVAAPPQPESVPKGRAPLHRPEAGDGPTIEIAWPSSRRDREKLYAVFLRCYGMVSAILDDENRLFRAADPPGRRWAPNPDRYGGFVRQVSGQRVEAENRVLARIRAHHRIAAGRPVRLFPRPVDAMLLDGLRQMTGARQAAGAALRARYGLYGGIVRVTGITVDNRPVPGSFPLRPACGASGPPPSS